MAAINGHRAAIVSSDIDELRQRLSSTTAAVLVPSDPGYDKSIQRWSCAAEKPAAVVIIPSVAEEVGIAVKYANDHGIDVAVKGGGHSTAGASSTDSGMLIDLSRMRNVDVDVGKQRLHIQGGALWGDVDEAAWEHGLATVGGTVADTGVGGLTLGGGYGALSGERGLVIDNIISATVVLANGEIKLASKFENSDLLWALQGAGQNFGVTTEFVLQAYPQKDLFMGTMLFPPTPEIIKNLVAAINDLYEVRQTSSGRPSSKSTGKSMGLLGLVKPPPLGGLTMLLVVATYNGLESEGRQVLKPLFDLNPVANDMRMEPYPTVNKLIPAPSGMRSSMKGAAFVLPIREHFVTDMLGLYEQFHASCPDAGASLIAWELFDTSKIVSSKVGSFANRGYHLNSLIMPMWTKAENDQTCRQWARDMSLRFKKELETQDEQTNKSVKRGASIRGNHGAVLLYGNYDQYDEISQNIFGENYARLQNIKAKYDPKNVFNKLFPITPQA